jgi:hypothetical protein
MSHESMKQALARVRLGWTEAGRDLIVGLLATARTSLMLCGAVAVAAAAALFTLPQARDLVARLAPTILPISVAMASVGPVAGPAADNADEPDEEELEASADPHQRAVTRYLSRRYRVADGAVGRLVAAAYLAGDEAQVDPLLVLAVMAVESSMNPFAESSVGAQGLMQVMTQVHADKFAEHGGDAAALDPIANIKVGTSILGELIRRGGTVERGLQLYVGAGNQGDDGGYGARVMAERARLKIAATAGAAAALAEAARADLARPLPSAAPAQSASPAVPAPRPGQQARVLLPGVDLRARAG